MNIIERIKGDMNFCIANPEEFSVKGWGFSSTRAMRTVIAMNEDATREEIIDALSSMGYKTSTISKQFAESRKISAETDA